MSGYEYHRNGGEFWATSPRGYNESCRFLQDRSKPLDGHEVFEFCKSSLPCQTCCRFEHQVRSANVYVSYMHYMQQILIPFALILDTRGG